MFVVGLQGRVALVTGGGRGIGKAIALGLAEDGADVAVNYRRDVDAAQQTVKEIEALGRRGGAYAASVDDYAQCEAMVNGVLTDFGKVDILVNNAGVASRGSSVADTELAEVERLLDTHAIGAWACAKLVLPSMREQERGDIVMISSAATLHMAGWSAPYNMAKAALEALALTLAKEERRNGIHVNIVAPGLVDTEMGRRLVKGAMGVNDIRTMDEKAAFGHVCSPEEVADAVRFVVSERGSYLTAQRIGVDGGSF
jgi:NAD(P)-dependent dehydrogenase (short-subunit alcohol dehydrogenase family)